MSKKPTILITGATGNIGGGAAIALAKRGAKIVLLGRSKAMLAERETMIKEALSEKGIACEEKDIESLVIDFTNFDSVKKAADQAIERYTQIDCLILSVGRLKQKGPNILPNGHEQMFATSVIGPFLLTQLLLERLAHSRGMIMQVVAPFYKELNWYDLESMKKHRTVVAYNRAKTCERILAGEFARRYAGWISTVAFDPTFVIDKKDPLIRARWPKGLMGAFWKVFAMVLARKPATAGEPMADLILSHHNHSTINGALFRLKKRILKPDKAMRDTISAQKLWDALLRIVEDV